MSKQNTSKRSKLPKQFINSPAEKILEFCPGAAKYYNIFNISSKLKRGTMYYISHVPLKYFSRGILQINDPELKMFFEFNRLRYTNRINSQNIKLLRNLYHRKENNFVDPDAYERNIPINIRNAETRTGYKVNNIQSITSNIITLDRTFTNQITYHSTKISSAIYQTFSKTYNTNFENIYYITNIYESGSYSSIPQYNGTIFMERKAEEAINYKSIVIDIDDCQTTEEKDTLTCYLSEKIKNFNQFEVFYTPNGLQLIYHCNIQESDPQFRTNIKNIIKNLAMYVQDIINVYNLSGHVDYKCLDLTRLHKVAGLVSDEKNTILINDEPCVPVYLIIPAKVTDYITKFSTDMENDFNWLNTIKFRTQLVKNTSINQHNNIKIQENVIERESTNNFNPVSELMQKLKRQAESILSNTKDYLSINPILYRTIQEDPHDVIKQLQQGCFSYTSKQDFIQNHLNDISLKVIGLEKTGIVRSPFRKDNHPSFDVKLNDRGVFAVHDYGTQTDKIYIEIPFIIQMLKGLSYSDTLNYLAAKAGYIINDTPYGTGFSRNTEKINLIKYFNTGKTNIQQQINNSLVRKAISSKKVVNDIFKLYFTTEYSKSTIFSKTQKKNKSKLKAIAECTNLKIKFIYNTIVNSYNNHILRDHKALKIKNDFNDKSCVLTSWQYITEQAIIEYNEKYFNKHLALEKELKKYTTNLITAQTNLKELQMTSKKTKEYYNTARTCRKTIKYLKSKVERLTELIKAYRMMTTFMSRELLLIKEKNSKYDNKFINPQYIANIEYIQKQFNLTTNSSDSIIGTGLKLLEILGLIKLTKENNIDHHRPEELFTRNITAIRVINITENNNKEEFISRLKYVYDKFGDLLKKRLNHTQFLNLMRVIDNISESTAENIINKFNVPQDMNLDIIKTGASFAVDKNTGYVYSTAKEVLRTYSNCIKNKKDILFIVLESQIGHLSKNEFIQLFISNTNQIKLEYIYLYDIA